MRPFRYVAYTPEGRRRRGIVLADDAADASARLGAQGLMAADLMPEAPRAGGRRLGMDDLAVFTRQMAVLLDAGLTAEAALAAVQGAASGPRVERLIGAARAALLDGAPLSEALRGAGARVPGWYLAALTAGERSGELPAVFAALAAHLEGASGERAALASALAYPAFVVAVALAVCGVMMTSVAPEIAAMFAASGQPLPGLTRAVMGATGWASAHWPWLALGGLAVVGLGVASARLPAWRDRRDRLSLRLPLIGRFRRQAQAAQYLRTLALVVGARLPLTEALDHAAGVLDIARLRTEAEQAAEALRRGERLGRALAGLDFLHPVSRQLIEAGEAGARLAAMTERAAALAEGWMRSERKRLVALLEPLAMVVVGMVVLVVVMAVLLPIFDLQRMVGG